MPRIYLPEFSAILPPKQAQHVRVLRQEQGDALEVFDGNGQFAAATLVRIDKKAVVLEIGARSRAEPPHTFPIHLAMSLIRAEPFDFCLQKAVELGVREITPILAERCQGRFSREQADKKHLHWQEIIIAACEQSGLNFLPQLHPITPLSDFIAVKRAGLQCVLDPQASVSLKDLKKPHPEVASLLIGPEGGLSPAEVALACSKGFVALRLHEQILRAETAALLAIGLMQFHFGNN